jgi:hypothetical protein
MAGAISLLMTAAPVAPAEPVSRVVEKLDYEGVGQALHLLAGQRDQSV